MADSLKCCSEVQEDEDTGLARDRGKEIIGNLEESFCAVVSVDAGLKWFEQTVKDGFCVGQAQHIRGCWTEREG